MYCPICGNVEPDYKCKCIKEATGNETIRQPVAVEPRPQTASEFGAAWAEAYETWGQG